MDKKSKKLFNDSVPDFVEAFEKICTSGFFESFSIKLSDSLAAKISVIVEIEFSGLLPRHNKEVPSNGTVAFVNVREVMDNIHNNLEDEKFKILYSHCETKYENWPKREKEVVKLVGGGRTVSGKLLMTLKKSR